MRHSPLQKVSFIAVILSIVGGLATYVRSEPPPVHTLTRQGEVTPRTRAIIRGESAYLLGPPEVVTDLADANRITIAPDGGAALIVGYKMRPYHGVALSADDLSAGMAQRFPELNVICWDVRTRVAQTLLRESVREERVAAIADIHWYPQTRIALLILERTAGDSQSRTLMQVNTSTGVVTRLAEMTPSQSLSVSPSTPMAFVYTEATPGENGQVAPPATIRFYTPQGSRPVIRLSEEIGQPEWMPAGKSLYAAKHTIAVVNGKRTVHSQYSLLDVNTGQIIHPDKSPLLSAPEEVSLDTNNLAEDRKNWPVDVATANVMVPDPTGKAQSLPALWLRPVDSVSMTNSISAKPASAANDTVATNALLVATNAEASGFLFGKNSAALLFTREGTLCATPIFRLSVDEFTRTLRQVQRMATLSNAKQIGLGLLMYSQDYDAVLPQPGSAVSDSISPYLKDRSLLDNPASGEFGFTYSYKGNPSLSRIDQPANTPLGYLSGADGRAIIWSDGHVTWDDGQ